jgi:hypothetical protein
MIFLRNFILSVGSNAVRGEQIQMTSEVYIKYGKEAKNTEDQLFV